MVIAHQRQLNVLSVSRWTVEPALRIINVAVDNVPALIVWPPAAGQDEGGGGFSSHARESHNMADRQAFRPHFPASPSRDGRVSIMILSFHSGGSWATSPGSTGGLWERLAGLKPKFSDVTRPSVRSSHRN